MSWRDFKKISEHITNFESYSQIGNKKVIRDYKKKILLWGVLFVLFIISFSVLTFKDSTSDMTLLKLDQLALPIIACGACQIYFMNEKYKLKLVEKYDNIIKNKMPKPDNV